MCLILCSTAGAWVFNCCSKFQHAGNFLCSSAEKCSWTLTLNIIFFLAIYSMMTKIKSFLEGSLFFSTTSYFSDSISFFRILNKLTVFSFHLKSRYPKQPETLPFGCSKLNFVKLLLCV